jgi:hypothetical protein
MMQTRRVPAVATSHFQQFLNDATVRDGSGDGELGPDSLYGLYVSWAGLHHVRAKSDQAFRAGMHRCGIDVNHCRLHMCGPAAADYILSSYPAVA